MADKAKFDKKIEIMKKYKQEYDYNLGPCGEIRHEEYLNELNTKNQEFLEKSDDIYNEVINQD